MKSIFQLGIIALLGISWLTACQDNEDPVVTTADIVISSPAEGAMIDQGAAVRITGTITSEGELHGYQLYIRKKADNTQLFSKAIQMHGKSLSFDEQWVNNVTDHTDMELEVVAVLNHEGDLTVSKKVNFHCHP